jgi:amino acid adenylation domain-containing protein
MKNPLPLSLSQLQMVKASTLYPDAPVFTLGGYSKISGPLNLEKLTIAILAITNKSEILNTTFKEDNNTWLQHKTEANIRIRFLDFSTKNNPEEEVLLFMNKEMNLVINSSDLSLGESIIIKTNNNEHFWFLRISHLIIDGWGIYQYVSKIWKTYLGKERNITSFFDLPLFQNNYDLQQWETVPNIIGFEKQFDETPLSSKKYQVSLSETTIHELRKLCHENTISLFHYFLAIYAIYWFRRTGTAIILGIHLLNRGKLNQNYKSIIGPFVNTLPLIITPKDNQTIVELSHEIQKTLEVLYSNQNIWIDHAWVKQCRGIISFENFNYKFNVENLSITTKVLNNDYSLYPLLINFRNYSESKNYHLEIVYQTSYFEPKDIEILSNGLSLLLNTSNLNNTVGRIPIISEAEKEKIIRLSKGKALKPKTSSIWSEFESITNSSPHKEALWFKNKIWDYSDLYNWSTQMSNNLNIEDKRIAIISPKLPELIVLLFALWKRGNTILLLDESMPDERLNTILEEATPDKIIFSDNTNNLYSVYAGKSILLTELSQATSTANNKEHQITGDYILYTSGSSGTPKGIHVNALSLLSTFEAWKDFYNLEQKPPTVLNIAPIGSDVFLGDIVKALLSGGKLILLDETERLDFPFIREIIKAQQVSLIDTTPTFQYELTQTNENSIRDLLKTIILGAEECPVNIWTHLVNYYQPTTQVINGYGLTETTIENIVFAEQLPSSHKRLPIGRPLPNNNVWILAQGKELLPLGEAGEICISGEIANNEYILKDYDDKFSVDPIDNSSKMYRTGDYGRWLISGNIEFLGRKDRQIQIRGYRVELGEVEALLKKELQTTYVVCTWDDQKKQLLAFCKDPGNLDILKTTPDSIPAYFLPQIIFVVNKWKLTSTGKADISYIKSLSTQTKTNISETLTPKEKIIKKLFTDGLEIDECRVADDYFALGGDSLSAAKLVDKLNLFLGPITYGEFYQLRSITKISIFYENQYDYYYFLLSEEQKILISRISPWYITKKKDHRNRQYIFLVLTKELTSENLQQIKTILMSSANTHLQFLTLSNGNFWSDTKLHIKDEQIASQYISETIFAQEKKYFETIYSKMSSIYIASVNHIVADFIFPKAYTINSLHLTGYSLENSFSAKIKEFIEAQPLLRSQLLKKNNKHYWQEYESSSTIQIPFIDLSGFSPEFCDNIAENTIIDYLASTDEKHWTHRFFLIKRTLSNYQFIYAIDDHIHDVMTDAIFTQWFIQNEHVPASHPALLIDEQNNGPLLSDTQLLYDFQLKEFNQTTTNLNNQINTIKQSEASHLYKKVFYNLPSLTQEKTFALFVHLFTKFWREKLQLTVFPFWIINNTRTRKNNQFNSLIADFTDIVPMTNNNDSFDSKYLSNKINYATNSNVNFLNLILNPKVLNNFPLSYEQLQFMKDVKNWKNLIVFNYQQQLDNNYQSTIETNHEYREAFYNNRNAIFFGAAVWEGIKLQLQHSFDFSDQELDVFFEKEINIYLTM